MNTLLPTDPLAILRGTFGYHDFRRSQREIIDSVLAGKDTLVLMPTGGGKSLCYQIPALVKRGTAIVVSPLIALMKDQVDALRLHGIAAAYLNSTQTTEEQSHIMDLLRTGELKLLYMAPERLLGREQQFINFIKELAISLVAVDEAHCISSWGHDFRPEYLLLSKITKALGDRVPVVALTATADNLTQTDIAEKLQLRQPRIFVTGFNRPNIRYVVQPKNNTYVQLVDFLSQHKSDAGIIYTLRRADTEQLAERLSLDGFSAKPYHAGLGRETKNNHQEAFLKDEVSIIVATIAFGMGIDKSNVRFVVHMDLPKNIEGYYQETGRAGRDGLPSTALMFYSYADFFMMQKLTTITDNEEQSKVMENKLREMANFGSLRTCRRRFLLQYFGEEAAAYCGNCDNCLTDYEEIDGTLIAQKALSAVTRLGQSFGVNYVIDFLRGSSSQKIREVHRKIKTFGVGVELSKDEWRHYLNELIQMGFLKRSSGQYPVLELTTKSKEVLAHGASVKLPKLVEKEIQTEGSEEVELHVDLGVILKELRKMIADSEGVPAYVVFSDASLRELLLYLPTTLQHLEQISGFGMVKVQRYGDPIIEKIAAYCKEHNLESKERAVPKATSKRTKSAGGTHLKTLELFKNGRSIREIAKERNLRHGTIESHLDLLIKEGKLQISEALSAERVNTILSVLSDIREPGLKPVKEKLPEDFSYGEIRMVMTHKNLNK
ncbi:DNA helicase RecQ [Fulvivirga sp. M361]|uniref:DNA helicase RecQ n=1 Tax=Fulvivirga sp. M361 TaxID=2594266 RepID=UPI00117AECE2|nr:DNA helicase RecQ [Fulvivirga sp. M361]TRX58716.1 DNA helicase RecQ [Fulvivirga sp. M361]